MRYFPFFILILFVTSSIQAQKENTLDFIPKNERFIFGDATWDLVYSNETIDIDQMIISDEKLIITQYLHSDTYNILFLNDENLIVNREVVKRSNKHKYLIYYPRLFKDDKSIYYGPLSDKQYVLSSAKSKIVKEINLNTHKQNKYYKRIRTFNKTTFESYSSLNSQKNELTFWLKSKDDNSFSYSSSLKSKTLQVNDYADYLQIKPTEKKDVFVLLDNLKNKLLLVSYTGVVLFQHDLRHDIETIPIKYKLEMDDVTKKIYLFPLYKTKHFYSVQTNSNELILKNIEKDEKYFLHKAQVYNNHLYDIFSIPKLNIKAVYKSAILDE